MKFVCMPECVVASALNCSVCRKDTEKSFFNSEAVGRHARPGLTTSRALFIYSYNVVLECFLDASLLFTSPCC